MGPPGKRPKPAATAATDKPEASAAASVPLSGKPPAARGAAAPLASEPRGVSFDQPLGEVTTLESLTKTRSQAPKGRRSPTKPIKIFCVDGSYRSTGAWGSGRPRAIAVSPGRPPPWRAPVASGDHDRGADGRRCHPADD